MSNISQDEFYERVLEKKIDNLRFKLTVYSEDDPDTILAQADSANVDTVIGQANNLEQIATEGLEKETSEEIEQGYYND